MRSRAELWTLLDIAHSISIGRMIMQGSEIIV
jgi:hypothetical protein